MTKGCGEAGRALDCAQASVRGSPWIAGDAVPGRLWLYRRSWALLAKLIIRDCMAAVVPLKRGRPRARGVHPGERSRARRRRRP